MHHHVVREIAGRLSETLRRRVAQRRGWISDSRWHCLSTGLALGLVFTAPSYADDCRDYLLENAYDCDLRFQIVTTTDGSDRILTPIIELGGILDFTDFDLDSNPGKAFVGVLDAGGVALTMHCTCGSEGDFEDPEFGVSDEEFLCVGGVREDVGIHIQGEVDDDGEEIQDGHLWFADPFFDPVPGDSQFARGFIECERVN